MEKELSEDTFDKRWDEKFGKIIDGKCQVFTVGEYLTRLDEMEKFR